MANASVGQMSLASGPYPGEQGNAEYCGRGSHTIRIALRPGDPGRRCIHCDHEVGKRVKRVRS